MLMFSYILSVIYDGSDYYGWECDNQFPSVRQQISQVIRKVFQCEFVIKAASRTDRRVHGYDQKMKLSLPFYLEPNRVIYILNNRLPSDIRIKDCIKINNDFNIRQSCKWKIYQYKINCGKYDVFQQRYVYQYNKPLNVKKLQKIANIFIGKHDFTNFSALLSNEAINRIRTIDKIAISINKDILIFSFKAVSFLRHQIRIIVGSILACYENKIDLISLKNKLNRVEDSKSNFKSIGNGLHLVEIKLLI